jgi:hypothetical protein
MGSLSSSKLMPIRKVGQQAQGVLFSFSKGHLPQHPSYIPTMLLNALLKTLAEEWLFILCL